MMRRRWYLVALLAVSLAFAAVAGEEETSPRDRFWQARRILIEGDAASAAALFRAVQTASPRDPVADDCLYWMGRCYLRIPDREPDAVVALNRLIREYPVSPFLDDAARELDRLRDRSVVRLLESRLAGTDEAAALAARALVEFGEKSGVDWLEEHEGKKIEKPSRKSGDDAPAGRSLTAQLAELRRAVRRIRAELDATLVLVEKLLAEKRRKAAPDEDDRR